MKIILLSTVTALTVISFKSFASEPEKNKEIEETIQFESHTSEEIGNLDENTDFKFEKIEREFDFDSYKREMDKKFGEFPLRADSTKEKTKELYDGIQEVGSENFELIEPLELASEPLNDEVRKLYEKMDQLKMEHVLSQIEFLSSQLDNLASDLEYLSNNGLLDSFAGPLKEVLEKIEKIKSMKK